jgi:hypothetical protein
MKNSSSENSDFQNADGLVPCPLSLDRASLLSENFKIHYCHPEELVANRGICKACRNRASKRAGNFKTRVEEPAEPSLHESSPRDIEHDHVGHEIGSGMIQVIDFDFGQVDGHTQDHFADLDQEIRHEAGTAIGMLLQWIWVRDLNTALRRLVVLTGGLRPELLGNKGFPELALELGTTKQSLSKAMINFQKQFRFKFSRGRSEEAKRHMSEAMTGHRHWSTRKKSTPGTAGPTPPY